MCLFSLINSSRLTDLICSSFSKLQLFRLQSNRPTLSLVEGLSFFSISALESGLWTWSASTLEPSSSQSSHIVDISNSLSVASFSRSGGSLMAFFFFPLRRLIYIQLMPYLNQLCRMRSLLQIQRSFNGFRATSLHFSLLHHIFLCLPNPAPSFINLIYRYWRSRCIRPSPQNITNQPQDRDETQPHQKNTRSDAGEQQSGFKEVG